MEDLNDSEIDLQRLKEKEEENIKLRSQVTRLEARVLELAEVLKTLRQDIKVRAFFHLP